MPTFRIRYDRPSLALLTALGAGPGRSGVEVGDDVLRVRMGWAFSAEVPLADVAAADHEPRRFLSRGVHGWAGRWLVNGSGDGLVTVTFARRVPARSGPFPLRLGAVIVSLENPDGFLAALHAAGVAR